MRAKDCVNLARGLTIITYTNKGLEYSQKSENLGILNSVFHLTLREKNNEEDRQQHFGFPGVKCLWHEFLKNKEAVRQVFFLKTYKKE